MAPYLITLGAGAILAAVAYKLLKREQRRSTRRIKLMARLERATSGGRAAGYYPGSLADPRD